MAVFCLTYWCLETGGGLPIRGTEEAAGGVESARSRSKRKKATNMFIPT